MGTNYYTLKKEPCPTCAHGGEDYHIGKSSAGWKFLFASYPNEGLTTAAKWREFLETRKIRDEYGDEIDHSEFWQQVDGKQADPDNWTLETYPVGWRHGPPTNFETLDPEGYRISNSYDFS